MEHIMCQREGIWNTSLVAEHQPCLLPVFNFYMLAQKHEPKGSWPSSFGLRVIIARNWKENLLATRVRERERARARPACSQKSFFLSPSCLDCVWEEKWHMYIYKDVVPKVSFLFHSHSEISKLLRIPQQSL